MFTTYSLQSCDSPCEVPHPWPVTNSCNVYQLQRDAPCSLSPLHSYWPQTDKALGFRCRTLVSERNRFQWPLRPLPPVHPRTYNSKLSFVFPFPFSCLLLVSRFLFSAMFYYNICLPSHSERPPCTLRFCLAFSVSLCLSLSFIRIYLLNTHNRQEVCIAPTLQKHRCIGYDPSPLKFTMSLPERAFHSWGTLAARGQHASATWAMLTVQTVHSSKAGLVHTQLSWELL